MKKTEKDENMSAPGRYNRSEEISESSRYSKAETFRTGSRYPDKSPSADGKGKKNARTAEKVTEASRREAEKAAKATSKAAKAAGARALRQAAREQVKVDEAKRSGGLKEYETIDIAKEIEKERAAAAQRAKEAQEKAEHTAPDTEDVSEKETAVPGKKRRWQTILLSVLLGLAGISYLVIAVFFAGRFYPGTTIYGINCTAKTADWVKSEIGNKIGSYSLTLEERENRTETIRADQIGLHYDDRGAVEERLSKQYSFLWPVMMPLRRREVTDISAVYDREHIDTALQTLGAVDPENQIPPENAYVGEGEEGYEVIPEVMGTTLRFDVFRQTVLDALDHGDERVSLEDHACYTLPSVLRDDEALIADAAKRNDLLGADIILDFSDRMEVIDTQQIMKFIIRDHEGEYKIDPDAIWTYVAELAEKYDTFGKTRTFRTSIGTTETLYGGDYGWAIEQNDTAQMILDDIREKKTETIEPIYAYTARSRNVNDIGDTYVEVCISRQEMWVYKDGYLVTDTPVVTGNPNLGNATPSGGVWAVDGKMQDYTLVGQGYRAPVDFWMPFNGNVGIHDLQSRYWFGSTIYLSNGSHGCVNTPLDAMEKIYEAIPIGAPVIVYEGEGVTDMGNCAWR